MKKELPRTQFIKTHDSVSAKFRNEKGIITRTIPSYFRLPLPPPTITQELFQLLNCNCACLENLHLSARIQKFINKPVIVLDILKSKKCHFYHWLTH